VVELRPWRVRGWSNPAREGNLAAVERVSGEYGVFEGEPWDRVVFGSYREHGTWSPALVRLIAESALTRTESRGAHLRRDFPELNPEFDNKHVTIGLERPATPDQWQ